MQPERIGPVRRSGREHAGQRVGRIAARVHLEHVAGGAVQPADHDELVAGGEPRQRGRERRLDLEPRIGRAFVALARRVGRCVQGRPDVADDLQGGLLLGHGSSDASAEPIQQRRVLHQDALPRARWGRHTWPATGSDGHVAPCAFTYTAYTDVVAQMKRRLRFGPPKHTLATTSGTRTLPIRAPSGAYTCTPSAALVHRLPRVSRRKPSNSPCVHSANSSPPLMLWPSSPTRKRRMWCGPSFTCVAPVSAMYSQRS